MKRRIALMTALCLANLLSGCAAHTYRSDGEGTTLLLRNSVAKTVVLFSSMDGFTPHAAERKGGKWVNYLAATHPATREFTYFYTVDGEIFIPDCRFRERDDFGQENCICIPGR